MFKSMCNDDACRSISTDERSATAQKLKSRGMGLIAAATGVLVALGAGLSGSLGPGSAIAIGIGASVGLFAAGARMIRSANKIANTEGKDVRQVEQQNEPVEQQNEP